MAKVDPYGCWDGAIDDSIAPDEDLDSALGSILDFADFPMEGLEGNVFAEDWDASKSPYHLFGPIPADIPPMDVLLGPPKIETGAPLVSMHRPPVTFTDTIPEVKQLNLNFDDAESSFIRRQHKSAEIHMFQSQSPVSVLESSASSLPGKSLLKPHIAKRTRTKRARPSGTSPWLLIAPFVPPCKKTQEAKKMKERRKKLPNPNTEDSSNSSQLSDHASAQLRPTKKCTHCEITKTPQWREGPLGPKTLCNACGVRYRSGRLFPEYRPAASPTFVPSLHSNSHKKVVEMRSKGKKTEGSMSPQPEFIPVSSYLFDPIC